MQPDREKRLLQIAFAAAIFVPIGAGLGGIAAGPQFADQGAGPAATISLDSHFRYLSGLLLAIGFGFASTIPAIETHAARIRLLTFIVFIGGLARLWSLNAAGVPPTPMAFGLAMELIITPILCLWQARVANAFHMH
jgi:hypothetical protein